MLGIMNKLKVALQLSETINPTFCAPWCGSDIYLYIIINPVML